MKVAILAGGYGTRFGKLTEHLPKPMIPVGPYPILWHIMRSYAHYGFDDFVLCLGYKASLIKDYFLNFEVYNNDFTLDFARPEEQRQKVHRGNRPMFYPKVTLVYTGLDTMTGGRIKRIADHLDGDEFLLTYGDGVSDLNINDLLAFHRGHGKLATLTAVFPPPKFGDLKLDADRVTDFSEKKHRHGNFVNGGFYVFNREVLRYLDNDTTCVLEKEPLERLAREGQLMAYQHNGFWQCMDTTRDMEFLNRAWTERNAPWKVWDDDYLD
ncbi:MAG TPA: glucose-1-phosphate cytidylyltransferase [Gemmataceae bacterium]|nr:glucose-1-phosphate cytidylyltransferase [Gemmataceae bacterium]